MSLDFTLMRFMDACDNVVDLGKEILNAETELFECEKEKIGELMAYAQIAKELAYRKVNTQFIDE